MTFWPVEVNNGAIPDAWVNGSDGGSCGKKSSLAEWGMTL